MDAWQGSQNTLYLATDPSTRQYNGLYFQNFDVTSPYYNFDEDPQGVRELLWIKSCEAVSEKSKLLTFEKCMKLIE
jgi:hypothetical protein